MGYLTHFSETLRDDGKAAPHSSNLATYQLTNYLEDKQIMHQPKLCLTPRAAHMAFLSTYNSTWHRLK